MISKFKLYLESLSDDEDEKSKLNQLIDNEIDKKEFNIWLKDNLSIEVFMEIVKNYQDESKIFSLKEIKELWKKLENENYNELANILLWENKIISDEVFCNGFDDVLYLSGKCYLYVDKFIDELKPFFDETTLNFIDGEVDWNYGDFYKLEHIEYLWDDLDENTKMILRKHCIDKKLTANIKFENGKDIKDYPLLEDTLIFKDNDLYVKVTQDIIEGSSMGFFDLKRNESVKEDGEYIFYLWMLSIIIKKTIYQNYIQQ